MIDASSRSARALATTAVFVAAGVHSCMNATFGWSLGATPFEKYLLASFGVAIDVSKIFALAFCAMAWAKGHKIKSIACFLLWVVTVMYSSASALGFAALTRDAVVASRTSKTEDYAAQRSEMARFQREMELARANPLFRKTYGCTSYPKDGIQIDPKKRYSRDEKAYIEDMNNRKELCSAYWRAGMSLEAAKAIVSTSTATEADPQVALIAAVVPGLDRQSAAIGLALFLALVAEVVSSLGTWTFSRSIRSPVRHDRMAMATRPKLAVVR